MKAKIDSFRFAGLNCDFQLLGSLPFVPGFNLVNPELGRNDTVDDFHLQHAITLSAPGNSTTQANRSSSICRSMQFME
ncbi:hypothetical protein CMK14_03095 [Candidatus Poribacteria bacterium]|nr:hypothetical protein [Candidatus Poribacteria bacterium]